MCDDFANLDISYLFIKWLDELFDEDKSYYLRERYFVLKALILNGCESMFKHCTVSAYKSVLKNDLGIDVDKIENDEL